MPNGDEDNENDETVAAGATVGSLKIRGVVVNTRFDQKGVAYVYEGGAASEQGPVHGSGSDMSGPQAQAIADATAGSVDADELQSSFNDVLEQARANVDDDFTPVMDI